jgi:hypothetical protein
VGIRIGSAVEYSEDRGNGTSRKIRGIVVDIERDAELLNLRNGRRRSARRFVIRDSRGKLHTTSAMAATRRGPT